MNRAKRSLTLLAAAATVAVGLVAGLSGEANASTHACDLTNPTHADSGCGSWNAEVPGLPDIDALGDGPGFAGQAIIVYPRSSTDRAEDFTMEQVPVTNVSKYNVTGTHSYTAGVTTLAADGFVAGAVVRIRYTPNGVPSVFCLSSVNPNGFASVQLRFCDTAAGEFNPYQSFKKTDTGNPGDGQFVTFAEVINNHLLTDPRNDGGVGVRGARVQVKFAGPSGPIRTGQLWGFNGA